MDYNKPASEKQIELCLRLIRGSNEAFQDYTDEQLAAESKKIGYDLTAMTHASIQRFIDRFKKVGRRGLKDSKWMQRRNEGDVQFQRGKLRLERGL